MAENEIQLIDLRGYQCPLPVLKTRNAMRKLTVGEQLEVLTDDPLAGLDIPNFCNEHGQELVSQKQGEGDALTFVIRRSSGKL